MPVSLQDASFLDLMINLLNDRFALRDNLGDVSGDLGLDEGALKPTGERV